MRRLTLCLCLATALAFTSCRGNGHKAARTLGDPCAGTHGEYLDFYFDDLRSHQPNLWSRVLSTCVATCPASEGCAPVRSVARWYGEWPERPEEEP